MKPDGTFDPSLPPGELVGPGTAVPVVRPDGKLLFAHNSLGDVVAWDLTGGKDGFICRGNKSAVNSLSVSTDGKTLLVVTAKELLVYSGLDGTLLSRAEQIPGGPNGLHAVLLPDGKTAFCYGVGVRPGKPENEVSFANLNTETGKVHFLPQAPVSLDWVWAFAIPPDGKHIIIANGRVPALHVISTTTGREVGTLRLPILAKFLALSPDGRFLIAGNQARTLIRIPTDLALKAEVLSYDDLFPRVRRP